MAERPDQIAEHIESARSELGSNLQELENKVRQEADWKTHFERNPMTLMGVAFGGGVLLASLVGSSSRRSVRSVGEYKQGKPSGGNVRDSRGLESWETLKGALIGLAGVKARNVLDELIPGFTEQYDKLRRDNCSSAYPAQAQNFESSVHRM